MTPPRLIAAQMYPGQNVGIGGIRTWPVLAATQPGETVLACVGANNASIAVSGMTDSKGNTWTYDREYNVGPYTDFFRLDGAAGGPGGGPSAALAPGDGLIVTSQGNVSAQMGMLAMAAALGPLQEPHTFAQTAAQTVMTAAPLTPAAGADVIAMTLSQGTSGAVSFDAPLGLIHQGTYGHVYACGYLADAAAAALAVTQRVESAVNSRMAVYSFLPVGARLPLKVRDGTSWRQVARV